MEQHIFMTGATGYLGRHLLPRLLDQGWAVTALVRPQGGDPRQRVLQALATLSAGDHARLRVVAGDAQAPWWGMTPTANHHGDIFLHAAGFTRLEAHCAPQCDQINRQGTENAFALAKALGIRRFHHISTTFVAGDHLPDFAPQQLEVGQSFRSPYEASKYEAERFLQHHHTAMAQVVVHRTSILVGGKVLDEHGAAPTIYAFLKALRFLKAYHLTKQASRASRDGLGNNGIDEFAGPRPGPPVTLPLRVVGREEAGLDLVLVTSVADAIVASLQEQEPSWLVRHHVSGLPTPLSHIRDAFCQALSIQGVNYVAEGTFCRSPLEERFYRATRAFAPYMTRNPRFLTDPQRPQGLGAPRDLVGVAEAFLRELTGDSPSQQPLTTMALDALEIHDPTSFFHRFTSGDFGRSFFQENAFVDILVRFIITGPRPFDQIIHFSPHQPAILPHDGPCHATFTMTDTTFLAIVRNGLDARNAFFQGQVAITGDMEQGLKLAFLLADYFRHSDDHLLAEMGP